MNPTRLPTGKCEALPLFMAVSVVLPLTLKTIATALNPPSSSTD